MPDKITKYLDGLEDPWKASQIDHENLLALARHAVALAEDCCCCELERYCSWCDEIKAYQATVDQLP